MFFLWNLGVLNGTQVTESSSSWEPAQHFSSGNMHLLNIHILYCILPPMRNNHNGSSSINIYLLTIIFTHMHWNIYILSVHFSDEYFCSCDVMVKHKSLHSYFHLASQSLAWWWMSDTRKYLMHSQTDMCTESQTKIQNRSLII